MATSVPADLFAKPRPGTTARPATRAAISKAERALGVKLPAALKALLLVRNGGTLRLTRFALSRKPPVRAIWARKDYSLQWLPGVGLGGRSGSEPVEDIVELSETATRCQVPPGLVPIWHINGEAWCCLDYRRCGPNGEPSITHIEPDQAEGKAPLEAPIARSCSALLAGLTRDPENLSSALIALDSGATKLQQLDPLLTKLGYKLLKQPGRRADPPPPAWTSRKYRSFVPGLPARIELWTNRLHRESALLTDLRPATCPILVITVAPSDQATCLGELLIALAPGAVPLSPVA